MKIYTKGGDGGYTSLIGGERVPKYDVRVEAYGTVDELSAQIALLRDLLRTRNVTEFDADLVSVSGSLMQTEALMAVGRGGEGRVKELPAAAIESLEKRIDEISSLLPPIRPSPRPISAARYVAEPNGKPCVPRRSIPYPPPHSYSSTGSPTTSTYWGEGSPCSSAPKRHFGNPDPLSHPAFSPEPQ